MKTNSEIRDSFVVAVYDWREGLRNKRVIAWLILYLLITVGACLFFAQMLKFIENEIANMSGLSDTSKPGAMAGSLMKSESFYKIVKKLVNDEELARSLVKTPPMALFFGWFSFLFGPLFIVILASSSIASDVSSRYIRFFLLRTSRFSFAFGKFISYAFLLFLMLLLSSAAAWLTGYFKIASFEGLKTFLYLLIFSVKAWFYTLPILGLTLAASQITSSQNIARLLGILFYFVLSILASLALYEVPSTWHAFWDFIAVITPQGHKIDFWRMDPVRNMYAALFSFGLGFLYFILGYTVLKRRDL